MVGVEQWAEIRRLHFVKRLSQREIRRRTGLHRDTISKAINSTEPPRYRRAPAGSKLDPFKDEICRLLREDPKLPGVRVRELLAPLGSTASKTVVDDYLREVRPLFAPRPRTFQRTVYRPGEICQFDVWQPREEVPVGHGQTRRGWVVIACLGYSRAGAGVLVFSTQTEDLLAGIAGCLERLGALPRTLVWDRQAGIHGHGGRPTRRSADFAVPASLWSGFLSVAVGGAFAVAVPVVPAIAFGVGVWYAAWSAGLGHYAHRMNGVAADPPDPRFDTPVQLGAPLFDVEALSGDDEFAGLSRPALRSLLEADRHSAAMVRAIERSQGAAAAGDVEAERVRFEEAEAYARDLGRHLLEFAGRARPVADATLRLPAGDWSRVPGGRLRDLLHADVLAELFLAGVPLGYLDVPIAERPTEDSACSLHT